MLAYDMDAIHGKLTRIFRKVRCDLKKYGKPIEWKSVKSDVRLTIGSKKYTPEKVKILLRLKSR